MPRPVRWLTLAALVALAALLPAGRAAADDEPGGAPPPQPPAAAQPEQLWDQTDRKKTMSVKLPRNWKPLKADDMDPRVLAGWGGFFGEEGKSPNGEIHLLAANQFSRAVLARAVVLPQNGKPVADSYRQGPGWAEGCVTTERNVAQWNRFVEKDNRVYQFVMYAHGSAFNEVRAKVERILDTASVPGESTILPPGDRFVPKKMGDFDVLTDAEPDRDASVKKAISQLGTAREIAMKALGGKPFDASRPVVWLYQNGSKHEDRVKAAVGSAVDFGVFSGTDRVALVTILSDTVTGHDPTIYRVGAEQYVWQHFGGVTPFWIDVGLRHLAANLALGGGKKLDAQTIGNAKSAVAAGKRRLDEWFDLASWNDVSDNNQGSFELFAWHWYFREGKGAKKYKKQYAAYLQTLRDTGDPAAARKAFDGVNFEEMLQEFRNWASDWKQ